MLAIAPAVCTEIVAARTAGTMASSGDAADSSVTDGACAVAEAGSRSITDAAAAR